LNEYYVEGYTLMTFRKAIITDIKEILTLVNQAYRGDKGWTTESSFVEGDRVVQEEVSEYLSNCTSHLFVLELNHKIEATICVEEQENRAYIGFFAVNPNLQAQGIGKQMLNYAENFAIKELHIYSFVMAVLETRKELIEFYCRRGYALSDKITEYPQSLNVGTPMVEDLKVVYLEKEV